MGISADVLLTIGTVIICVLLTVIGFHYWLISRQPGMEKTSWFYYIWKRFFGIIGILLYGLPAVSLQIIHDVFKYKKSLLNFDAFVYTGIIAYPVLFLAYYLLFVMFKRKV